MFLNWRTSGVFRIESRIAPPSKSSRVRLLTICTVVFLTACGVRLLYWQDNSADLLRGRRASGLQMMTTFYYDQAQRIVNQNDNSSAQTLQQPSSVLLVAFASGDNTQVRLSLYKSNPAPAIVKIGPAELFEIGPTPYQWTRYPRAVIRGVQRNLFKTTLTRMLIVAGIILLALARRGRALAILLIVPVYFLLAQSPLHTEYRYILAIHYFLFVMAAAAIYYAGAVIVGGSGRAYLLAKQLREG